MASQTAEKVCRSCKVSLPASEFWKMTAAGDGLQAACKNCQRSYAGYNDYKYEKYIQRRYGLADGEYEAILAKQDGVCAICKSGPGLRRFCVDHDHLTGKVRGILCNSCNAALGHFQDSPEILIEAAAYLSKGE